MFQVLSAVSHKRSNGRVNAMSIRPRRRYFAPHPQPDWRYVKKASARSKSRINSSVRKMPCFLICGGRGRKNSIPYRNETATSQIAWGTILLFLLRDHDDTRLILPSQHFVRGLH